MKHFGRMGLILAATLAIGTLTGCEVVSFHDDDNGKNGSPAPSANAERQKIIGTWKVVTEWRWSKMTFHADGTRSVVDRVSGDKLSRGTWRLENGKLVVVSDVTEVWTYSITGDTMNVTLPSGNKIQMVKLHKGNG